MEINTCYLIKTAKQIADPRSSQGTDKAYFAKLLLLRHVPYAGISFDNLCDRITQDAQILRHQGTDFDWGHWSRGTMLETCEQLASCDMLTPAFVEGKRGYRPTQRTPTLMRAIKESLDHTYQEN